MTPLHRAKLAIEYARETALHLDARTRRVRRGFVRQLRRELEEAARQIVAAERDFWAQDGEAAE